MSEQENWEQVEEAVELVREGQVDAAIEKLNAVVVEHPSNEYAYYFLGHAWFEKKNFAKSLKAYLKAVEVKPSYLGALIGCGHALRMMNRLNEALKCGRQVLALKPKDPDALYLLGLAYFARDDRAAARQALEQLMETKPEVEVALEVEGMLKVLQGDVVPFPQGGESVEA